MSVSFPTHAVRRCFRSRLGLGKSAAEVYADISAACYRAVRELSSHDQEAIDFPSICRCLSLDEDDREALKAHIAAGSALDFDAADPWLERITTEINSEFWMTISEDSECPVVTKRGTRPGSSWADVVFGLLMKRIIVRRDQLLRANSPLCTGMSVHPLKSRRRTTCQVAASDPIKFKDLIWADDLATPLMSDSAEAMTGLVAGAAGALLDAFAEHAMEISYGPLKTAAVVALRGPKSRAVKRRVFGAGTSHLVVVRANRSPTKLLLVECYRQPAQGNPAESLTCLGRLP